MTNLIKSRAKNIYFWLGIVSIVLSAADIDIQSMTSWSLLMDATIGIFMNPFKLSLVITAVLGVFVDTSTPGLKDGAVQ